MGNIRLFRKPEQKSKTPDAPALPVQAVHMLPVDRIVPNPNQPRKVFDNSSLYSLAESIRQYGILQPLSVRHIAGGEKETPLVQGKTGEISLVSERVYNPNPQADKPPLYEVIAGERRLRAAILAGLKEVPCLFSEVSDARSAELAIVENIQREDLNIFEEAEAISQLIRTCSLTQEQAAARLSYSQSYIANKLRLLRLTEEERQLILENGLTERHARALLRIVSPDQRKKLLHAVIGKTLNVSQTEELIDRLLSAPAQESAKKPQRKLILKDIRIFYNTIERAVDTISRAGIDVLHEKREDDDAVEYIIRVPKHFREQGSTSRR